MDTSYISVLIFLLTTILYYLVLTPKLSVNTLDNNELKSKYYSNKYIGQGIYLLLVVVTQFAVNAYYVINTCGGSSTTNIGYAFIITFIPWIFIFGITQVVLILFPGFKSAFSNVFGYMFVAGSANSVLSELLTDVTANNQIINDPNSSESEKRSYQTAADTIIKLAGNMSILINQIVPENFNNIWKQIITPLMKEEYKPTVNGETVVEKEQTNNLKQKLLDIVVLRNNIGEGLWYLYTAILLTSIVQYKIVSRGCIQNLDDILKNQEEYNKEQQAKTAAENKSTNMVYTLSG